MILAVAGIIVSSLALHVHYSNDVEVCDINAHWDCGIVNHSRYAMIGRVPVAIVGITGYAILGLLAFLRRYRLLAGLSLVGVAFALYLTHIEAHVLQIWCLYCVTSQVIIALMALLSVVSIIRKKSETVSSEP